VRGKISAVVERDWLTYVVAVVLSYVVGALIGAR